MKYIIALTSLISVFAFAGCSTTQVRHPDFGTDCEALAERDEAENVQCVRVFYGTNRDVDAKTDVTIDQEVDIKSVDRSNDDTLHLGRADVWLPRLIEEGGARERGETPMLTGNIPEDKSKLEDYVFLTRITTSGKERFLTDMQIAVEDEGDGSVLLFVHGFNVQFESALIRSAQLAADLSKNDIFNPGTPALFSWPSAGKLTSYKKDRKTSLASAPHLTEFLNVLTQDLDIERINIIAHSMGNRVLTQAIEDYADHYLNSSEDPDVEFRIILAAADVDRDVFNQVTGVLDTLQPNVTIYTSDGDRALKVSEIINRATRLGYTDGDRPYIRENPAYQTVDATGVASELFGLGHSYYSDNPFVLGDMLCTLLEAAPDERALERRHFESDPTKPEYFQVSTEVEPLLRECSLVRDTVPAAAESDVYREPPRSRTLAPPPPPPPAPPVVAYEVAPAPRLFEDAFYYESGEAVLAEDELEARLLPTLDDGLPHSIEIDAYTDTVGSSSANASLSLKRANQIRDWYIARGVDPEQIFVNAHGEDQEHLLVKTPDNTDEPQNRVVFLRLTYLE